MPKLRVLLCVALASVILGCTPAQLLRYHFEQEKAALTADPADDQAVQTAVESYFSIKAEMVAGRPCAEWYDTAIDAGWRPDQWPVVSQIMWGESNCDPNADNGSSSALGLMQHLRTWAANCGIPYDWFRIPYESLKCALTTYLAQGWNAWEAWNGRT